MPFEFDPEDQFLTDVEAAPLIGVKASSLPTLRSMGRGPKYFKDGRIVRYTLRHIKEYRAKCVHTPEPASVRRQRKALVAETSQGL
jgi:hypothetical protein